MVDSVGQLLQRGSTLGAPAPPSALLAPPAPPKPPPAAEAGVLGIEMVRVFKGCECFILGDACFFFFLCFFFGGHNSSPSSSSSSSSSLSSSSSASMNPSEASGYWTRLSRLNPPPAPSIVRQARVANAQHGTIWVCFSDRRCKKRHFIDRWSILRIKDAMDFAWF